MATTFMRNYIEANGTDGEGRQARWAGQPGRGRPTPLLPLALPAGQCLPGPLLPLLVR